MTAVTVVVITRNRRQRLAACLDRLTALPDDIATIVVDNGSADNSVAMVRNHYPDVTVVALDRNVGAVARNMGVAAARTAVVAFADDDSGWMPGSLDRASDLFDRHPRLGLIAARVSIGASGRIDPICADMRRGAAGIDDDLPGPNVMGFLAFAAIVRREAFSDTGGFDDVVFFMGEEERVAYDLTSAGWGLIYRDDIVAEHHPDRLPPQAMRHRVALAARNRALTSVMRRPSHVAAADTLALLRAGTRDRAGAFELARFAWRLPRALLHRRTPSVEAEARLALLLGAQRTGRTTSRSRLARHSVVSGARRRRPRIDDGPRRRRGNAA
jgi:GT2 family glycosyltransferase